MQSIINEQYSDDMKQEIEAHDSFNIIHNNMDTIELLKPIKMIDYKFHSDQYPITPGVGAMKRAIGW